MERTTDSIERLASLMDKMDTKLDREKINTGPEFTKVEVEDMVTGKITMVLEIDHILEISTQIAIGKEETTITEVVKETIGLIIRITVGPEIETTTDMVIDSTIDQTTEGKTVVKGMVIETRTAADPEMKVEIGGIGVAPEKVPNPETVVDPKIDTKIEGKVEMIPEIGTGPNQDLDPLLMEVLIETEAGVIGAMNITILQENVLTIQQIDIQVIPKALF